MAVAAVAACGGDDGDELSIQSYADRIGQAGEDVKIDTQRLGAEFDRKELDSQQDLDDALEEFFREVGALFDEAADVADALREPSEVSSEHDDYLVKTRLVADAFDDLSAATGGDDDAAADAAVTAAFVEYEISCTALVTAVDSNGGQLTLDCQIGTAS